MGSGCWSGTWVATPLRGSLGNRPRVRRVDGRCPGRVEQRERGRRVGVSQRGRRVGAMLGLAALALTAQASAAGFGPFAAGGPPPTSTGGDVARLAGALQVAQDKTGTSTRPQVPLE